MTTACGGAAGAAGMDRDGDLDSGPDCTGASDRDLSGRRSTGRPRPGCCSPELGPAGASAGLWACSRHVRLESVMSVLQ